MKYYFRFEDTEWPTTTIPSIRDTRAKVESILNSHEDTKPFKSGSTEDTTQPEQPEPVDPKVAVT